MILGRTDSTSILSLSTPAGPIQRVTTFKLLGLHLDASLSRTTRPTSIPLYPKPAKDCTTWNNWKEQASHHTFLRDSNPPSFRVRLPSMALLHQVSIKSFNHF